MAKQNNRTCIICGKHYSYCPTCGEDSGKPTWYFIFDGENCHDIYDVCTAYRDKEISIADAYTRIKSMDLSDLDNFAESTKAQIKEILAYKPSKEEIVRDSKEVTESKPVTKSNFIKNKNRK